MKAYILYSGVFDHPDVVGVFASEAGAWSAAAEILSDHGKGIGWTYVPDTWEYEVAGWVYESPGDADYRISIVEYQLQP